MGTFRFVARLGIVASALIGTTRLGIWDDSEHTAKLYNVIITELKPLVKGMPEKFDMPPLPPEGEYEFLTKQFFNRAVKKSFNFVTQLPGLSWNALMRTTQVMENYAAKFTEIKPLQCTQELQAIEKRINKEEVSPMAAVTPPINPRNPKQASRY